MVTFKTTKLQEMTTKASKGVGNNKLKPLTELIAIKVEDNALILLTTDGDNFLYITEQVDSDDFYAVVQANQFVKLISKLTSEDVSLDVVNNCLEVRGNGNYKIPVEIDATTGEIVEYPDPFKKLRDEDLDMVGALGTQDIANILRALKPSLSTTMELPQYINYYLGDTAIATDTDTVGCYHKALATTPVLVSPQAVDILGVYTSEEVLNIYKNNNRLLFCGDGFTLISYAMPGVEKYAISKIMSHVGTDYPYKSKLPKQDLVQALERLSLFVSPYDEDTVYLRFGVDGNSLQLSSKQSDSVECISYIESNTDMGFECAVYFSMLTAQVKATTGDTVEISYGASKSIKLDDTACNVTSILCLVV